MIKKILKVFIVVFLGSVTVANAQDPEFSQFYANQLYLNPAFAGSSICPRMSVNYRNQWPALDTYVTYSASYDQRVDALEGGLGLLVTSDVQADGLLKTNNISGMYAYTLNVNRNFSVKGGFEAAYRQKSLDPNFIFPDQIHPLYGAIYPTKQDLAFTTNRHYFDFSAGLVGYSKTYFFGVAVHHLTEPIEGFINEARLPRKYTVHFGTKIPLQARGYKKGELSISPNLLFQQQQDFQQLNFGMYLNRKDIVVGMWFRQNLSFKYDSFIMLLGFAQDNLKFAYSYDFTVSKLNNNSTLGAHEVSFGMTFNCRPKRTKFRTISCPSF